MNNKQIQEYKNHILKAIDVNFKDCPSCRIITMDKVHDIFNEIHDLKTKIQELGG